MNEAETRAELIDPALQAAGWGVVAGSRVYREHITSGRLLGAGKRGTPEIADYVLSFRNLRLAVIEAKRRDLPVTEGLAQAKRYAGKLQTRFAYATNGVGLYQVDMATGAEGHVTAYPGPEALWALVFAQQNDWRDRFAAVALLDKSGSEPARYYQDIAVDRAVEALAAGRQRVLLTLATGTGKTKIAFHLVWKLFQAKWNLSGAPTRRPRVLFLADRNTLADQALEEFTSFNAFEDAALVRITPDEIAKKGRVPKNGSVFFTIFQSFMSGRDAAGQPAAYFGAYPADFFDCIIIDECHRGGARDESTWREILTYFAPAVQVGLTATPKRRDNVDTYAYFGDPVFSYSLREGINDGFLTPFKVKQIATTLDEYMFTVDDDVIEGMPEAGRRYREGEFNRTIEIEARERYRVQMFMGMIDQREKTLVFCATQGHAALVRDLINQTKTSKDPDYCVRVTANDGAAGEAWLRVFRNNEKSIPTVLTTSQKLSTGVDARNVRNIVLMRPVNSMIEFKQIIGRGTRLFDGKDFFTIYDFVRAYEHFNDPEWDGDPVAPVPVVPRAGGEDDEAEGAPEPAPDPAPRPGRVKIRLADGKERQIQSMVATSFWGPDGVPLSAAQFVERLFGALPELLKDEDALRALWSVPETRRALLAALAEKGFGPAQLAEIAVIIAAENCDLFDVLGYIGFALPVVTRAARVEAHRAEIHAPYDAKLRGFLDFVLGQYVAQGVGELDSDRLSKLIGLKYGSATDAQAQLGALAGIRAAFVGFQAQLYGR